MTKQQLLTQITNHFAEYPTVQYYFTREVVIVEDEQGNLSKEYTGNKQLVIRGVSDTPISGTRYEPERIAGETVG